MALTKQSTKYEFLARWDDSGKLKGAHIIYREAILEDGVEISSKYTDPRPVVLTDDATLSEIGAAINTGALADREDKVAQLETLSTQLKDAEASIANVEAVISERDEMKAAHQAALLEIDDLLTRLTKYENTEQDVVQEQTQKSWFSRLFGR